MRRSPAHFFFLVLAAALLPRCRAAGRRCRRTKSARASFLGARTRLRCRLCSSSPTAPSRAPGQPWCRLPSRRSRRACRAHVHVGRIGAAARGHRKGVGVTLLSHSDVEGAGADGAVGFASLLRQRDGPRRILRHAVVPRGQHLRQVDANGGAPVGRTALARARHQLEAARDVLLGPRALDEGQAGVLARQGLAEGAGALLLARKAPFASFLLS